MDVKVIGYFTECKGEIKNAIDVFVAIDDRFNQELDMMIYCPVGQHSGGQREYLKECREITKEEYLKASGHLYTPADYLK